MNSIILTVLTVFAALILLIFVLLCLKTGISYELEIENFSVHFNFRPIIFGKAITVKKSKKTAKKAEKPDESVVPEQSAQKSKKISLSDIREIKESLLALTDAAFELLDVAFVIERFDTFILCSLPNPAANGVLYGGVCAALNVFYGNLAAKCNIKSKTLTINCDFDNKKGLLFKNRGKIYMRPIRVLARSAKIIIRSREIFRHIKRVQKLFSQKGGTTS